MRPDDGEWLHSMAQRCSAPAGLPCTHAAYHCHDSFGSLARARRPCFPVTRSMKLITAVQQCSIRVHKIPDDLTVFSSHMMFMQVIYVQS